MNDLEAILDISFFVLQMEEQHSMKQPYQTLSKAFHDPSCMYWPDRKIVSRTMSFGNT